MSVDTSREAVERLALSLAIADQPITAATLRALAQERDAAKAEADRRTREVELTCAVQKRLTAERDAARAEVERLREIATYYADTFCEFGTAHECCGRLPDAECSGCKARAALAATEGKQ